MYTNSRKTCPFNAMPIPFFNPAIHRNDFFLIAGSSQGPGIYRMDIETRSNYPIPVLGSLFTPIALDYDPVDSTIYWTEVGTLSEVRACNLDGSNLRTLLDAGQGQYQASNCL